MIFFASYHNLTGVEKAGKKQTFYYDNSISILEEEGEYHYYLKDELGSPVRVSGYGGEETAGISNYHSYGYDEFGNDLSEELKEAGIPSPYTEQGEYQPFGYTGYRYDTISSTFFAQAREYQPRTGRFMAEDVIKGNGLVPETLNPYAYCFNNPLMLVDLDGKKPLNSFIIYPQVTRSVIEKIEELRDYVEESQEVYQMQRETTPVPVMPTDPTGLPDYTEEIDSWLFEKTETFIKQRSISLLGIGIKNPFLVGRNELSLIFNFYNEVKTEGPMDIKQDQAWETAFEVEKVDYFIYHGEIMDAGTLGNITYGYAGAAIYPDFMLYYGGGFANMKNSGNKYIPSILFLPNYGDAPEDIDAIRKGIQMWEERNKCIDE